MCNGKVIAPVGAGLGLVCNVGAQQLPLGPQ